MLSCFFVNMETMLLEFENRFNALTLRKNKFLFINVWGCNVVL
jgi:hypothetical protein